MLSIIGTLLALTTVVQGQSFQLIELPPQLQGVGLREQTDFGGYKRLSMMGGAKMLLKAEYGLNEQTGNNQIQYNNYQVQGARGPITTAGPGLSRDDEFYSNTAEGKLAFTTPSVMDLFKAEFSDFDGSTGLPTGSSDPIEFYLSVDDLETEAGPGSCKDEVSCVAGYRREYTPMIHEVVPNQIYRDHAIDWHLNAQAVHWYDTTPEGRMPMEELSIDGALNNWEDTIDASDRLDGFVVDRLSAVATDQKPNKNSTPRARFITGDSYIRDSAIHCNFAGDDCWTIRTHAVVESVSANSGNVVGGQQLTIKGWGFENNASVTVAGVPCEVTKASMEELVCVTGQAAMASVDNVDQPGQPGITRKLYNPANSGSGVSFSDLAGEVHPLVETAHELVFESATSFVQKMGQTFDGYFKAPETGEYRFFLSCDDSCDLKLDSTNPLSSGLGFTPVEIANRWWYTNWREYFNPPEVDDVNQYISEWITLTAGEYYKIDAAHINDGSSGHFTVSVEFKSATMNISGHKNAAKETQILEISQDQVPETWSLTVTDPSNGAYYLVFQNPNDLQEYVRTEDILTANMSADTFAKRIRSPFYKDYVGASTTVTKTNYDEFGNETTDPLLVKSSTYVVQLDKRIDGFSYASVQVLKDPANTSTISVTTPTDPTGSASSVPISGNFILNCPDPNAPTVIAQTREIEWWKNERDIERIINEDIPFLASRTYVRNIWTENGYFQNARKFAIQFLGIHQDMPQCFLSSGVDVPLLGNNVQFPAKTTMEYGQSLLFEPVPMEMLYTAAKRPQILVEVDGIPAACKNVNCDYLYVGEAAEVTSMSINGSLLTVQGTNLPTDIIDVVLGDVSCGETTSDGSQISCTLNDAPCAGTYTTVKVVTVSGTVPVSAALAPFTVGLAVMMVNPNTNINQDGGDLIFIMGNGFPQDPAHASVTFSDGTKCSVKSTSSNAMLCIPEQFAQPVSVGTPYGMTVAVSLTTAVSDNSQSVTLGALGNVAESISPNSLSPVLKQDLTVQLAGGFPTITDLSAYTAKVIGITDPTYERIINIFSFDDATKTLVLKFNGAPSGDYIIDISNSSGGSISGNRLGITTVIGLDTISPLSGSVLGGTLLTLTGAHYGRVATDNPVKVGDHYCLVESVSDTEIKCRIALDAPQVEASAEVIVFAKASEEMVCNINAGAGCVFDFVASTTSVDGSITASFDAASNNIQLTVGGSGFTAADLVGTELFIDGMKQETVEVTTTTAKFNLVNVKGTWSDNIQLYTAEGMPSGSISYASWANEAGLISISSNTGSSGGSIVEVTGVGFGTGVTDVDLVHVSSGTALCDSVEVTGYGKFICETKAITISSADALALSSGGMQKPCLNSVAADCSLTQELASSPQISTLIIVDPETIQIDGSGLPTGMDVSCEFQGVQGSTVMPSPGQVICSFEAGIPAADSAASVKLSFTDPVTGLGVIADSNGQSLTNALSVGSADLGVECSFAGGCAYTVQGNGLAGAIQSDSMNKITVCENECELDLAASNGSQAVCKLPALATAYSANQFDIVQAGELEVTWVGTGDDMTKLNDGVNTVDVIDSTSSGCMAQASARVGYTFSIDAVKIFLTQLIDKTPYIDGALVFEGSNDGGATWTQIYAYTEEIHEGWNSVDWRSPDSPQVYKQVRFLGAASGSCRLGEVKLVGVEVLDDSNMSTSCMSSVTINGVSTDLTLVNYDAAKTPSLTAKSGVSPRYGSVLGGETLTLSGDGFTGPATVMIDDRECAVTTQTAQVIICTTMNRPEVEGQMPSLSVYIDGLGYVATRGLVYRYVSRWSDTQTWGGDLPPFEGEAVEIPAGRHLLVDVPEVPRLAFVVVYGSLIFESNDVDVNEQKTFDANYIMVNGGYLEVGTEDFPYMSKLTITMHGVEADPYLPIYGNKVIAVRYGQLEMHGAPRSHVWTELETTSAAGSNTITLMDVGGVDLDWQAGEKIVIASTDFDGRHAEERTILSVTNRSTNPVITLDEALEFEHFAALQTFGADTIEMRAEVGLLSRNVLFRGDEATTATNQYGAHIMMHSPGDESVIGRIENCEFFDVGQAFKLGRYPIHYHMIGTVTQSYIKKNSIHQTYNRATTLHGVHYLEISGNVAYKAMGHTVFIEDAIETNNLIENNLIVDTRASNSLLNTDQTPACFWITNPNNIFRGNHCAGSDRYAYWYDTQKTAIGPSFDPNVCPENTKIGEFSDNVAHSVGRYGLRIFHNLIPRTNPCSPLTADLSNLADPYASNPVIPAKFMRLTAWKAGRNGAIAERVGAVEFHDFKVADNILAGAEMSLTEDVIDGYAKIVGGVFVGRTANSEADLDDASPHGIIAPRTEGFTVDGARFYNYNFNSAAALGDCSHCFHPASTDSGARTYTVLNLEFPDASVTKKIRYQYPQRGIFHDVDGSLTGTANSYATYADAGRQHVQQPECVLDTAMFDGVTCDDTVEIRRVAFYGYSPDHFRGMTMNILPYDNAMVLGLADKQAYIDDSANYSGIFWKEKLKPGNSWAVPFVTGHKYRITWANDLDYTNMRVQVSEKWEADDADTFFMLPFVDAREAINVTDTDTGLQIMDKSLLEPKNTWTTGFNWLQNATDIREFEFVVNGRDLNIKNLRLQGLQCISGTCPQDTVLVVPISGDAMFWSDPNTWESGQLPVEGEDVEIPPGKWVVLDIETPVLNLLTVNGRLSFYDALTPIHLHAKQIYVRAGELLIGEEGVPYQQDAQITLYGERHEQTEVMSGSIETGNKLLLNTGLVSLHGLPRSRASRLQSSVYKGYSTIQVETGLDWKSGDEIYLAPTNHQWMHSEYRTVQQYEPLTGMLTLDSALDFYHYGASASNAADYDGLDMRGEVRLLTRNVRIVGNDNNDNWGGNILTMDRMEFDGSMRIATTKLDSVEVDKCSQQNTYHAAIRFENNGESKESYVKNSVVHGSEAWSLFISGSSNILIEDSDFIGSKAVGVNLNSVSNVTVDNIFVGDVGKRVWEGGDNTLDKEACVAFCSYWEPNMCQDSKVTNSIAAGCAFAGFVAPGHGCNDDSSEKFRNNVAHSGERVGAHIYPDPADPSSNSCYEGSYFKAYKNRDGGLTTMYNTQDLRMSQMTFVDNQLGVTLQTAGEREDIMISMTDVKIFGEMENSDAPDGQSPYCKDKTGMQLFGSNRGGKELHPTMKSALPVHKIKSYGSWGGKITLTRVSFNNFESATTADGCGKKQRVITRNKSASDYIPLHRFEGCTFNEVSDSAVIWIEDPPQSWANPTDCIEWPCTAPENVVLLFENTQFTGSFLPVKTNQNFQIVSDVEDAVSGYSNCQTKSQWSAAYCTNRNLGVLLFESLDADNEDRTIQPVHITNEVTGYKNKVNSMMDHMWDGFYTGQKRLSRFPVQIETLGDYTVQFTGTPANSMRFVLRADIGAIKIKIPYPNAGSYTVFADGIEMPYTPWDKDLGRHAELTKNKGCGENRYVGVENFLEFYLTTQCEIDVVPRDSIMVSVRLDWTLEEFYADGGVMTFTDRMAAVLGVHASQIKTVAVYEGSVILEFFVETEYDDEEPEKTLSDAEARFVESVVSGNLDLGAPIIDAMSNNRIVKQNYENSYQGKDGNLWDYLIDQNGDNTSTGGNTNTGGNTDSGNSQINNGQTGTGGSTTYVDESGNVVTVPNTQDGSNPQQTSNSQGVVVVTQEIEQPEMTETVKYLIVFLAVLSVALIIVIVYIATRMCSRRTTKVERRLSVKDLEPQFVIEADGAKNIFNGRKRKGKHADAVESTSGGARSVSSSEMKLRTAVQVDSVADDPHGTPGYAARDQHTVPDTDRGFNSARGHE